MSIEVIVAIDSKGNIGLNGALPWPTIPEDLLFFKRVTQQHIVVMGRRTWESIGVPTGLPNRLNVVVSSTIEPRVCRDEESLKPTVIYVDVQGLDELMDKFERDGESIFVIGGARLYERFLPRASAVHITLIEREYESDVAFPLDGLNAFALETFTPALTAPDGATYRHLLYKKTPPLFDTFPPMHPEFKYINMLSYIMNKGVDRGDRTGVGTRSVFGTQMRFDISEGIVPLLTTKRVPWKSCIRELLFFLRGDTDTRILEKQGVNIWKGNTSREFLDKRGLDYPEGCMGPAYSWQWRAFGAHYNVEAAMGGSRDLTHGNVEAAMGGGRDLTHGNVEAAMGGGRGGVDQIANVLDLLRNDPFSRRILFSAWNPQQLDQMALPPCHMMAQFYVTESQGQKHLSCQMYQRSVDTACGLPWNMLSYALLTHLLAFKTGMVAKELILVGGDAHVYTTHFEGAREQARRQPRPWPKIVIDPAVKDLDWSEIDATAHFQLIGYMPHAPIKFEMAV